MKWFFSPLQTGHYPPADVASGGYVQGMGLFSAMKYFSKYMIFTICSSYRALLVRGQRYCQEIQETPYGDHSMKTIYLG